MTQASQRTPRSGTLGFIIESVTYLFILTDQKLQVDLIEKLFQYLMPCFNLLFKNRPQRVTGLIRIGHCSICPGTSTPCLFSCNHKLTGTFLTLNERAWIYDFTMMTENWSLVSILNRIGERCQFTWKEALDASQEFPYQDGYSRDMSISSNSFWRKCLYKFWNQWRIWLKTFQPLYSSISQTFDKFPRILWSSLYQR